MSYYIDEIDFSRDKDMLEALQLFRKGFGNNQLTKEWWEWKYLNSPFGKSIGYCARDNKTHKIIGTRFLWKWQLDKNGEKKVAFQMTDTITDSTYRKQGIYQELTKTAINRLGENLVFNFPNPNSAPLNLKMGWTNLGNIPWIVGITYPQLKNKKGKLIRLSKNSNPYTKEVHTNTTMLWSTKLTPEFLEWKLNNNPLGKYYLYEKEDTVIIFRLEKIKSIRCARILWENKLTENFSCFMDMLNRNFIYFYLYNSYNHPTYDFLKKRLGSVSVLKNFHYFSRNLHANEISLQLIDTDFL